MCFFDYSRSGSWLSLTKATVAVALRLVRVERAYVVSGGTVDWVAVSVRSACSCLAAGQADIDVKKAPPQGIRGMLVATAEVGREKASNPAVRTRLR